MEEEKEGGEPVSMDQDVEEGEIEEENTMEQEQQEASNEGNE